MKESTYKELQPILEQLIKQSAELEKTIAENNVLIQEAECFEQEIISKDEEDFKVFSPRTHEDLYHVELNESNTKKIHLQEMNQTMSAKKKELDVMIHLLVNVELDYKDEIENARETLSDKTVVEVDDASKNGNVIVDSSSTENGDSLSDSKTPVEDVVTEGSGNQNVNDYYVKKIVDPVSLAYKLECANRKLDLCTKLTGQDPMRVKIEIGYAKKEIEEVINTLNEK